MIRLDERHMTLSDSRSTVPLVDVVVLKYAFLPCIRQSRLHLAAIIISEDIFVFGLVHNSIIIREINKRPSFSFSPIPHRSINGIEREDPTISGNIRFLVIIGDSSSRVFCEPTLVSPLSVLYQSHGDVKQQLGFDTYCDVHPRSLAANFDSGFVNRDACRHSRCGSQTLLDTQYTHRKIA